MINKDNSLDNFINQTIEKRLDTLILLLSNTRRFIINISLKEGKIYYNKGEIIKDILNNMRLNKEDVKNNYDLYKEFLPLKPSEHRQDLYNKLLELGIIIIAKDKNNRTGYKLSYLGELTKGFISYILEKFVELEISPKYIFYINKGNREGYYPNDKIRIIEYIVNEYKTNKKINLTEIYKKLNIKDNLLRYHLKNMMYRGLIVGKGISYNNNKESVYYINIDKAREYDQIIKNLKINDKIRRYIEEETGYKRFNSKNIKKSIRYIINIYENKKEINAEDLMKKLGINYEAAMDIIKILNFLGILENNSYNIKTIISIEPTKKLFELYNVIKEIEEVSRDPYKLYNYKGYKLKEEKIKKLIEIYNKESK
ncbi:hypothetical protein YN1_7650 [Nanoarchaeota archaeon]